MKAIALALTAAACASSDAAWAESFVDGAENTAPLVSSVSACPGCDFAGGAGRSGPTASPLSDSEPAHVQILPWRGSARESQLWAWPGRLDGANGAAPRPSSALESEQSIIALRAFHEFHYGPAGSLFGGFTSPGEPAFGPPSSSMRGMAGLDSVEPSRGSHWLDAGGSRAPAYTVGYQWRHVSVERSAFTRADRETLTGIAPLRPDSSSTRFSYRPAPGWSFQISRGSLGGMDQVNPADETRRTSISATYSRPIRAGDWQTTFAWGRSVHANREPSVGYLVESTARIGGADAIFGRLEQVRSDELLRQNDGAQREFFKLKKLTLGYYRDLRVSGGVAVDIGAFASRYFVPSSAVPSYGSEPTAYMLFLRVKLR